GAGARSRSLAGPLAATAGGERNLRLVLEAVPDAIVVRDRDGRAVDMNANARAMLALPSNAAPDRSIFGFLDADAGPTARQHLDAAFQGEVRRFEVSFRRPDGGRGMSAVLYAPVRGGWRVSKVLAVVRDAPDHSTN